MHRHDATTVYLSRATALRMSYATGAYSAIMTIFNSDPLKHHSNSPNVATHIHLRSPPKMAKSVCHHPFLIPPTAAIIIIIAMKTVWPLFLHPTRQPPLLLVFKNLHSHSLILTLIYPLIQIIYKHYQRVLSQWPVDLLRPEISFQSAMQRRIDRRFGPDSSSTSSPVSSSSSLSQSNMNSKPKANGESTTSSSITFDEPSELEQVNVLYSLLENRYLKQVSFYLLLLLHLSPPSSSSLVFNESRFPSFPPPFPTPSPRTEKPQKKFFF